MNTKIRSGSRKGSTQRDRRLWQMQEGLREKMEFGSENRRDQQQRLAAKIGEIKKDAGRDGLPRGYALIQSGQLGQPRCVTLGLWPAGALDHQSFCLDLMAASWTKDQLGRHILSLACSPSRLSLDYLPYILSVLMRGLVPECLRLLGSNAVRLYAEVPHT